MKIPLTILSTWWCRNVVTSPEEDVVDLFADVRSKAEQLAVDAVQDGLQILPLPRVLAVK